MSIYFRARVEPSAHATAGEAVFAPATPDAAEDDGYVMAFVHNPDPCAADLVILAAQDFIGQPVAIVHLPARIPPRPSRQLDPGPVKSR